MAGTSNCFVCATVKLCKTCSLTHADGVMHKIPSMATSTSTTTAQTALMWQPILMLALCLSLASRACPLGHNTSKSPSLRTCTGTPQCLTSGSSPQIVFLCNVSESILTHQQIATKTQSNIAKQFCLSDIIKNRDCSRLCDILSCQHHRLWGAEHWPIAT